MRRLHKGPRPQVSASEAKTAEDIPAASADEEEVPQVATSLSHQEAVLEENVIVSDPLARQMEVENLAAATTNTTEATDAVMAEANVEPSPTKAPEVSEATDPATSVPESAVGLQFDYHVEHRPQVQKRIPRLPRFPGPASAPGSFNINGFREDNTFFNSSRNPYSRERISSDRFWSYPQRSYYSCILYNQGRIFPHMRLHTEAIAGLPCLEEALDCFKEVGLLPFITDQEH